jgi:hypothetical protein
MVKHRKPNRLPIEQRGGMNKGEAADYIGVGLNKIDDLIKQGKLKTVKIDKRLIVVVASARALVHGEVA